MALLGNWTYVFTDGIGVPYVASGQQVMVNFDQVKAILNNLDEANFPNVASKVMLTNRAETITAVKTFTTNPVFNALAIPDAALSANVPLKNAANTMAGDNTFSGSNSFTQAIENFKPPVLLNHPTLEGDDGKIYIYSGVVYVYKHGTGPVQLDYTGAYAGGAMKSYSGEITMDSNTPAIIMVKVDAAIVSAKLKLIAFLFPAYVYTELAAHSHAVGSLELDSGALIDGNHVHNVVLGSHTHTGSFGNNTHTHAGPSHVHAQLGTFTTDEVAVGDGVVGHTHETQIYGNTESGGTAATGQPSASTSVVATDLGTKQSAISISGGPHSPWTPHILTEIAGSTAYAGIVGAALNDTIKANLDTLVQVYISTTPIDGGWGTAKTYLTAGWSSLANLLAVNGGTDEIDISSFLSVSSFNYIKIAEPTAKKGGRIAYHVEIS